jgi:hypothetical protein
MPEVRAACTCAEALRHAVITPPEAVTPEARARLGILLDAYLPR